MSDAWYMEININNLSLFQAFSKDRKKKKNEEKIELPIILLDTSWNYKTFVL